MSFYTSYQTHQHNLTQNPQIHPNFYPESETFKDCSTHSTRKSSTDSLDFKIKYKTEVCKYWINGQTCPFQQSCAFAHGDFQMRSKQFLSMKYKTRVCKNFESGCCMYGVRCQFIHQKHYSKLSSGKYQQILNIAKNDSQYFFLHQKRLKFFKILTNQNKKELNQCCFQRIAQEEYYNQAGIKPRLYSL